MPELPDVEEFRRYCNSTCLHQTVNSVDVKSKRVVEGLNAAELDSSLKGKSFESTDRHGKYLFLHLSDQDWLVLHFGMTGDLKYYKNGGENPEYTQVLFNFKNSYHLAYSMPRKLGKIRLISNKGDFIQRQELGPDALGDSLDFETFNNLLSGRRGMVKSTLMNQQILAGIGNVYSDEILFQAEIYPRKKLDELSEDDLHRLYSKMREVLRTAIRHHADPEQFPESYLIPHRSEGEDCPRCDGKVKKVEVSGRTGYYCPSCQPE